MKIPIFTVRQWISIGLFILGLTMPIINIYYNRKDLQVYSFLRFLEVFRLYQWLPFTVLLWLGALYSWSSNGQLRLIGWTLFGTGIFLSVVSWLFGLVN
jgi:hypothetical protein